MHVLSMVRQLGGKELSFNNVLDLNGARGARRGVRAAGLRDHQAQQPVRVRGRRDRARGLREGLRVRPAVGLRRRRLLQPRRRRARSPRRSSSSSRRSSSRRKFTDEALEVLAAKPKMRILEDNERRRPNIGERDLKRVMGGLLVQDRDIDLEDRSAMEVVTERKPTRGGVGRDAVRLEGLQARPLQRDRDLARPGVGRHRRRADEPRGLRADRDREGGGRRRRRSTAARWRQTRSSRSPTARSWRSTPACAASSSRAARCATPRSSRPPTRAGIAMVFTHRRHFKH